MAKNLSVLAYDLGSSGGKVVRCRYSGERLYLDTIHQFPNRPIRVHGSDFWDTLRIHGEAMHGLRRALSDTPEILSIGFSTWGVDYGLLDSSGKLMNLVHSYRDNRTEGLYQRIFEILPQDLIYKTTGIMFIRFNTIVQLYADLISQPYLMDNADAMLLMPDLFTYLFTRQIASEVTISSTTQMVNPATLSWALELPDALGIPTQILQPIVHPGKVVGAITSENAEIAGASQPINVVAVGGHDTASAIAGAPIGDPSRTAFISAGTWSLLGMELDEPVLTDAAFRANFTNEVGVGNKIAFHKIIAGMWLLQGLKLDWEREGKHLSYEDMARAADRAAKFAFVFDPDDERFMNPLRMTDAISECVHGAGDPKPSSVGEFVRAVYECLALDYRYEIEALERVTGHTVERISIVGGGSRAELLCQMVADATGREVVAGPAEATSIGNALVQLAAAGEIASLQDGRDVVRRSCELRAYHPSDLHKEEWARAYERFSGLKSNRRSECV